MRTLFFLIFFGSALTTVFGQTQAPAQKIGYADWEYIFSEMPEFKQIDSELKAHKAQLQTQLEAKSKELETKIKTYQGMPATTPDAIKADKERELQQLQEGIQKFSQDAQTSLQNKNNTLMDPVFTKVGKSIEDVARENGYTFIINPQVMGGGDILLYSDEKYDISALVLKKMGITPSAKTTPPKTN